MQATFIGLGSLGHAMAGRLIDTGVDLTVWNRTIEKAEGLKATVADSLSAAVSGNELIILCLADSTAVRSVLDDRRLLKACAGKLIIDTTTNDYRDILDFHKDITAAGGAYLECPVAGSVVPAAQGNLTLIAGGSSEDLNRARPLLDLLGRCVFHFENPGDATRMKLVNNLALGGIMATLAEAVEIGEAAGLDRAALLEVLAEGGGKSLVLDAKKQKLLDREWSPHFAVDTIAKDLGYVMALAEESGLDSRMGTSAADLFRAASLAGLGDRDFSAVAEAARRRSS